MRGFHKAVTSVAQCLSPGVLFVCATANGVLHRFGIAQQLFSSIVEFPQQLPVQIPAVPLRILHWVDWLLWYPASAAAVLGRVCPL